MKTLIFATTLIALGALVYPAPSISQTGEAAAVPSPTEPLPASSARDLYKQAEAYRTGNGASADPDRALAIYEELAATGHRASLQRLGKIYVEQGRGEEALAAYQQAAAQDSALARLQIAIGHSRGDFGSLSDPAQGVPRLKEIAETENSERALYALAEAYRKGQGTNKDLGQAFKIYTALAARDYASAYLRLGDFHRLGLGVPRDMPAAIAAYQAAIAGGKDLALMGLAKAQIADGQTDAALATLNRAAELNLRGADAALAMGHYQGTFGNASQPALGLAKLRQLAEQGDVNAGRIVLRDLENRGSRVGSLNLDAVLTHMTRAAAAGNARATASLARFYRVLGRRVPNAKARHSDLIEAHGDQLKPSAYTVEKLYAIYDPRAPRASRVKLAEFVQATSKENFSPAMRALRSIDRNAYTYVLQQELKANGFYDGPINGMMSKRTVRSALEFCQDLGVLATCNFGPLTGAAAKEMIKGFAERRK